jgi:sporulation protein YlmC with PRC-barrel domain
MKKINRILMAIFFVFALLVEKPLAQDIGDEHETQQTQEMSDITGGTAETQILEINRISEFIGQTVNNQQGEEIGEVNDVLFDNKGNISYMILSKESVGGVKGVEGVMDVDSELIPIPWKEDKISIQKDNVILSMDQQKLDKAPSFSSAEWENLEEQEFQERIHGYYGTEKDKNNAAETSGDHEARQALEINRISEFIGQSVKNQQGEEIGEVNDVVFDSEGNISYMILSKESVGAVEGVMDVDSELIPIPWKEDKISIQEDNVILSMDQQKLDKAPSFSSAEWESLEEQEFRERIHGYYGTEKDKNNAAETSGDHEARQAREISDIRGLVGQTVRNREGEEIGEISFIILSRGTDEMDLTTELVLIPWQAENITIEDNTIVLAMDRQKLDEARSFTSNEWERFAEQESQDEVHGYYGAGMNKDTAEEMSSDHDARQTHAINRLSEFIGQTVNNQQGEEIGEVNDILFDSEGNISYMILSKEGVEGVMDVDSELIPIPWQKDKISIQEDNVILSMDQQKLDKAPSFSSAEWENLEEQEFQERIHGYYNDESQEKESQDIIEQEAEFFPLTHKDKREN